MGCLPCWAAPTQAAAQHFSSGQAVGPTSSVTPPSLCHFPPVGLVLQQSCQQALSVQKAESCAAFPSVAFQM